MSGLVVRGVATSGPDSVPVRTFLEDAVVANAVVVEVHGGVDRAEQGLHVVVRPVAQVGAKQTP